MARLRCDVIDFACRPPIKRNHRCILHQKILICNLQHKTEIKSPNFTPNYLDINKQVVIIISFIVTQSVITNRDTLLIEVTLITSFKYFTAFMILINMCVYVCVCVCHSLLQSEFQ